MNFNTAIHVQGMDSQWQASRRSRARSCHNRSCRAATRRTGACRRVPGRWTPSSPCTPVRRSQLRCRSTRCESLRGEGTRDPRPGFAVSLCSREPAKTFGIGLSSYELRISAHLRSFKKHVLADVSESCQDDSQTHARKDVRVVALTGNQCFAVDRDWVHRAATGEDCLALRREKDRWVTSPNIEEKPCCFL